MSEFLLGVLIGAFAILSLLIYLAQQGNSKDKPAQESQDARISGKEE